MTLGQEIKCVIGFFIAVAGGGMVGGGIASLLIYIFSKDKDLETFRLAINLMFFGTIVAAVGVLASGGL